MNDYSLFESDIEDERVSQYQRLNANELRNEIGLAADYFGMPDDLIWLNALAPEMLAVLDFQKPNVDIRERESLEKIIDGLQIVSKITNWNATNFPWVKTGRLSLHNYYGRFPHYCIYLKVPTNTEILNQWRAMVATLLPMLYELDHYRRAPLPANIISSLNATSSNIPAYKTPLYMAARHEMVCLCLRNLARPDSHALLNLMTELPPHAMSIERWAQKLEDTGFKLNSTGPLKDMSYLQYVVQDKLENWTLKRGQHGGGNPDAPRRGRQLRRPLDGPLKAASPVEFEDAFGGVHRLRHYFPRQSAEEVRDEKFDRNLKADQPQVVSTLTLDTDRSLEYFLKNRAIRASINAKYCLQAIERFNQHLPLGPLTLSGYEVSCFLRCLSNIDSIEWKDIPKEVRLEVAVWSALRYFLSRGPEEIVKFRFVREFMPTVLQDARINSDSVVLRSTPPEHNPPKQLGHTVKVESLFILRLPQLVRSLLKALKPRREKLFSSNHEAHFHALITAINKHHFLEITPRKLEFAMAEQISQMAPADWVIGNYFKGASPSTHIPSIYSAVPVSRIQSGFDQACQYFQNESGVSIIEVANHSFPSLQRAEDAHLGSLHVPTLAHMKKTVGTMVTELQRLTGLPGVHWSHLHNLYTAYCVLYYMATCGARVMGEIFPTITDIDWYTGVAFMSSKDSDTYQHANLIWLHPRLIEQFKKYCEHLHHLPLYLSTMDLASVRRIANVWHQPNMTARPGLSRARDLEGLSESAPMFFFISEETGKLQTISPTLLARYLGSDWELRAASLRHFVRSELMVHGLSGEVIGALLGHADRGQQPWADLSSMPPIAWRHQLAAVMQTVMETIGLQVIPSPFLGGMK